MNKTLSLRFFLFFAVMASLFLAGTQSIFANDVYFNASPPFQVNTGQKYTYTLSAVSVHGYPVSFSFSTLPSWLSFNSSTRVLSGSTNTPGTYAVHITASDGHGASDQQSYFVYVIQTGTPTPTQTPVTTPSVTVPMTSPPTPTITTNSAIVLYNFSPKDNAVVSTPAVTVSGYIKSGFALDKKHFSVAFDNFDVTNNTALTTKQDSTNQYENFFSFKEKALSNGRHTVSLTITTPDNISVPEGWSFVVSVPATKASPASSIQNFFSNKGIDIALIIVALLIFIAIIGRLIMQAATPVDNNKGPDNSTAHGSQRSSNTK
jgi:hypothetical protein